jgi:hypothetical protein
MVEGSRPILLAMARHDSPEATPAADLQVSTGSIVDTALRHLAGTDPDQVLELLRAHGHLTEAEYAYIESRRGTPRTRRSSGGRGPASTRGGALSSAGTSKAKAPKKTGTQARRQS